MSAKNLDNHNRWRSKTIAFRVSPEENEQLEIAVRLSGLTKQDYITRRLLNRDIVVQGNPRVYKALRDQLAAVLGELRRMEAGGGVDDEPSYYWYKLCWQKLSKAVFKITVLKFTEIPGYPGIKLLYCKCRL